MRRFSDLIRFKGTHMTGQIIAFYGDAPHRLLRIRWTDCPVPDDHLYHEDEVESIEKREHNPSRLYGSQGYSKYENLLNQHKKPN